MFFTGPRGPPGDARAEQFRQAEILLRGRRSRRTSEVSKLRDETAAAPDIARQALASGVREDRSSWRPRSA